MATAPTLKEMKGKIDGNELDLSMSSLEIVPIKELAQLRKATILDLSCNRFDSLPEEFCRLEHLVKLDLSQNQLMSLPENFGRLVNLEKLDLYKNQLEVLPLSMFRLKKLKWLDVKDNPLVPTLAKVAGDCLDTKQCQSAATKIVRHLQQIQAEQEREKQNRLAVEREKEAARRKEEEDKKRQMVGMKKKDKGKKKGAKQSNGTQNGTADSRNDQSRFAERKNDSKKKGNSQDTKGSFMSRLCGGLIRFIFTFLFVVLVVTGIAAGILYWNCSSKPEWLPSSRALCKDLYHFSATGQPPKNIDSLLLVTNEASGVAKDRFDHLVLYLRNVDYAGMAADVQEKVSTASRHVASWVEKDSGPWLKKTWAHTYDWFQWLWEESKLALRWTLRNGMDLFHRIIVSVRALIEKASQ